MKKTTIVIVAILLVLAMGQVVMASKGDATGGIILGYDYKTRLSGGSGFNTNTTNSFMAGISGNYYVMEKFSISAKTLFTIGEYSFTAGGGGTGKSAIISINVFGKYDIYVTDMFIIGAKLGGSYEHYNLLLENEYMGYGEARIFNSFFVSPGVYASVNVSPKINIYGDFVFPVFTTIIDVEDSKSTYTGVFNYFLYDITLGAAYAVSPNITLGIEGNFYNASSYKLESEYSLSGGKGYKVEFNAGLKIGYKF